jgi:5S rRNA maturation endonuclease (ribonuclease M5)
VRPGDFYTEAVRPALFERLDQVFPEFGWRRDSRGWVATNEQHTHARFGVRAERVVAHGPTPPTGLYIHGEGPVLWTEYVTGGTVPTGADFVRAVKEIAERAGVDTNPLESTQPRDRRPETLHAFFDHCQRELASERGAKARQYLERRDFPADAIQQIGLGLVPTAERTRHLLGHAGHSEAEISASAILADSRWPGRLCGAWRDDHGRVGTLWARTLDDTDEARARFLYLRGASRTNLPPYGLSDVLGSGSVRREIVLVEGLIDVHQLRARGIENVAALGGTSMRPQTFERLQHRGIETITLCLDNDDAGRAATARVVEQSTRAKNSPHVYVVDPQQLAPAKDPDELIRVQGLAAWHAVLATRACGIEWRALQVVAGVTRESPAQERRAGLARAGRWLGTLPPRLALEAEAAVGVLAEQCGHSPEAVSRAFRGRFWRVPGRDQEPDRARPLQPSLER